MASWGLLPFSGNSCSPPRPPRARQQVVEHYALNPYYGRSRRRLNASLGLFARLAVGIVWKVTFYCTGGNPVPALGALGSVLSGIVLGVSR